MDPLLFPLFMSPLRHLKTNSGLRFHSGYSLILGISACRSTFWPRVPYIMTHKITYSSLSQGLESTWHFNVPYLQTSTNGQIPHPNYHSILPTLPFVYCHILIQSFHNRVLQILSRIPNWISHKPSHSFSSSKRHPPRLVRVMFYKSVYSIWCELSFSLTLCYHCLGLRLNFLPQSHPLTLKSIWTYCS